MLRSDLCDYSDAYVVVKELLKTINVEEDNKIDKKKIGLYYLKTIFHLFVVYQRSIMY